MDTRDALYNLLEGYIRCLPFSEKIDFLTEFGMVGHIAAIHPEDERLYAFRTGLEKLAPKVTIDLAHKVSRQLILEIVRGEIDRRVAEEQTHTTRIRRPRTYSRAKAPSSRSSFRLIFVEDKQPLTAGDFSQFLALFNEAYEASLGLLGDDGLKERTGGPPYADRGFYLDALRVRLRRDLTTGNKRIRTAQLPQLVIQRIRKSSPLVIWFAGLTTALVIAVILAGGEVDLVRGRFKVHALGDGLRKLREVFVHPGAQVRRPSGKMPRKRKK
jgi:hypothetical protein